jgi:integral membrane protein
MLPMTPKKLHRIVAYLEMFTWTFLIVGMILKYSGVTDAVTSIAGGIHGFGFLCFIFITTLVWINNKWPSAVACWAYLCLSFRGQRFHSHCGLTARTCWKAVDATPTVLRSHMVSSTMSWPRSCVTQCVLF